jgi:hypothetical protein
LAAAVLAVIVVGTANAASTSADPKAMVLRLADLPAGFGVTGGHYVSNVRAARESDGVTVADYRRWGRVSGYERAFTRQAFAGLAQVESSASIYKSAHGAAESLHDSFRAAARPHDGLRFKRLSTGGPIGHESRFYTLRKKSGSITVDVYVVLWRYGTVRAGVTGGGVAGTVVPEQVMVQARKQQRHIKAALR